MMKNSTVYGIALILGVILMIVTMFAHPTGADILPGNKNALHGIQINVFAHSIAIASLPISFFGFFGFSQILEIKRPSIQMAIISYGFSVIAGMCAAVFSGFGATGLAKMMLDSENEPVRNTMQTLFHYNGIMNQGFAKIIVTASSVAVILWSIRLIKINGLAKFAGILGLIIGAIGLLTFFAGFLGLDVQGFGLFVFAQAFWTILVAVWLFIADLN